MNETQCIIEMRGYSKRTPITWLKDPTRHLLKIKAFNAKDSSDEYAPPSQADESPPVETEGQTPAD
ncbi:MAG: hypothetical protein OXG49_09115 [Chloroflexi bacterium]|nr:hypothetical protein [Chloroflexota bacterium]